MVEKLFSNPVYGVGIKVIFMVYKYVSTSLFHVLIFTSLFLFLELSLHFVSFILGLKF